LNGVSPAQATRARASQSGGGLAATAQITSPQWVEGRPTTIVSHSGKAGASARSISCG